MSHRDRPYGMVARSLAHIASLIPAAIVVLMGPEFRKDAAAGAGGGTDEDGASKFLIVRAEKLSDPSKAFEKRFLSP